LGLGNVAVEAIGLGLQDDGTGNLRVNGLIAADSTNQSVISSFHMTERHATGALTYTCPLSSTLFSGYGFFVYALTASVTFAVNAADAFSGGAIGTSLIIPPGSCVYVSTNATGTWFIRQYQNQGLGPPGNLRINATVAGDALTIALKDQNGNDPTTASPILLGFRDPTATNGEAVARALTSALSIVIPSSATLGTASAVPNRLWLVLFDNAGTLVLGVVNCVVGGASPTSIFALDETNAQSGIAISAGSLTAGVLYSGSTITTKSFRIIGFVESTQAIAGIWATTPSKVQLFGPGIRKPGDVVQSAYTQYGTNTAVTTNYWTLSTTGPTTAVGAQLTSLAITPTAAANMLRVRMQLVMGLASTDIGVLFAVQDATAASISSVIQRGAANSFYTVALMFQQLAQGIVSTTFKMWLAVTANTAYSNGYSSAGPTNGATYILIEEIMG